MPLTLLYQPACSIVFLSINGDLFTRVKAFRRFSSDDRPMKDESHIRFVVDFFLETAVYRLIMIDLIWFDQLIDEEESANF